MGFNPWAQAAKISNIFGVDSAILSSGSKWSGKWQRSAGKAQSVTRKAASSASNAFPSGRTGTDGVMVISRTKAQRMEFDARKAERERRDAEKAEARANRLYAQANKASLKGSRGLDIQAEAESKKAERLMKESIKTQNKIMRDDKRDTKVLSRTKMKRYENNLEKELRLMKAARPVSRRQVSSSRPQFLKVKTPPKLKKYGGGASVSINRKSPYIKKLGKRNSKDYMKIKKLVLQVEGAARSLSQGPYSLQQLARLGHPYSARRGGIGRLSAITPPPGGSRRDVVNKQSGTFLRSWGTDFSITPSGFEVNLYNTAPHAWLLAKGTKKMVSHGPWKAAFRMYMPQINKEFSRIALDSQRIYLQQEEEKKATQTMTTKEKRGAVRRQEGATLSGLAGGAIQ